jgi:hypothetical protein
MRQESVYGSPSDAVTPIQLKNFRIHGVAATNAKAGDKLAVLVRAEITSDQPEFHLFMQGITNLLLGKANEHGILIQMDRVCAFLVVTHKDGTADLYLQDFPVQAEMMSKRDVAKGEAVYQNGIADIRRLRMPWLTLKPDDGVLYCFKVGWKFALFFDLDPGRELDVDAMERSLGRLYRRLLFQGLYEALESEEGFGKLIVQGWFPFIETIGGEFEKLLKAYKNDFNVEDETRSLIQRFDAKRIDAIGDRWWRGSLLARHRVILEPALDAFKRGDAVSCLKIILTEIEGVLQDAHIGEQGHGASAKELLTYAVNKGIEKAGDHHSLLFPVQFLRYMRDYTYAQFDPKKPQAHVMSRYSVGHGGAAPAAYTMERALQAILTLDQLNFYGVGVNHTVAKGSADAPNASGRSEDTAAKRPTS